MFIAAAALLVAVSASTPPVEEPSYGYVWNFCEEVPTNLMPGPCKLMGKTGVVMQWAEYSPQDYYCFIIGHYDQTQHELTYKLLDAADPSKGVSISYPAGEKCSEKDARVLRSATIDITCANVDSVVVSAQEPSTCQYHLTMKSYHGCPKECPITKNGLCDSHGHCAFDPIKKQSYCYCNSGYSGSSCSSQGSGSSDEYDGFSVQLGLLITLLLIALGLTGGVVYLAYEIAEFRKQQIDTNYSSLPDGESEMVSVNFS
ncbi:hypothetical protein B484DRAFT_405947 [Ochromonadaceae sp. CCMP2298]|nr:hypothetical protein B484DRAFT_405947 [Ochromonadaceae sp. CCMP2298]